MKSEDKIINALNVLDSLCAKEKSLVNKFIVSDMSKSLRDNFKFIQTTLDSQDSHVQEQQDQIDKLEKVINQLIRLIAWEDINPNSNKELDEYNKALAELNKDKL